MQPSAQQHVDNLGRDDMGSGGEGGDVEELVEQLKNPTGGFHFFLSHKQSPSYVRDADGNKTDEIMAPSAADALGDLLGELRARCAWVKCWYAPEVGEVDLPTMMEAVKKCENFLLFLTEKMMTSWQGGRLFTRHTTQHVFAQLKA